jgi:hypothetical protein
MLLIGTGTPFTSTSIFSILFLLGTFAIGLERLYSKFHARNAVVRIRT